MKAHLLRKHHVLWPGILALFLILAGCGPFSSDTPTPQPTLILSQAPSPTVTQSTTPTPSSGADWTTYHNNNTRTGYIADAPDPKSLTQAWNKQLDGAVYAEPLVVNGHVIVATEEDSLYSLDVHSGQVLWHTKVGTPVPLSDLPCGNIDPLGITGTPVYDPDTHLIFAVAEVTGYSHILLGLNVNTGKVLVRQPVDAPGMDARAHQQRAALALAHGMVYVAYGGLDGDCSDYIGRVVALHTNGQGPLLVYTVPTSREAGIWAPPGPAVDGSGNIYVAVGNGASTGGDWDHSDSILKLSPTLKLEDGFAPRQWAQDNAGDADLGSMGPVLLPGGLIFADGKSGLGYLLHANALGGVGGEADVATVCTAFGGSAVQDSTIIVPCTDGIRQVVISPDGHINAGWHAHSQVTGSPVIGGHTVYSLDPNGGTLYALNMQDNAGDADLGSMGPVLLPGGLIFADGKSGLGYLLHANALGGVGGQADVATVCTAFGGSAVQDSTIIVPCTDGIRQVVISPDGHISAGWHAHSQITGSPVIGGHTVYSLDPNGGTLYALNMQDGNTVTSLPVGATSRFATPTLSGSTLFVGTMSGVTAVTIHQ